MRFFSRFWKLAAIAFFVVMSTAGNLSARRIRTAHKVLKAPAESSIPGSFPERVVLKADTTLEWKSIAERIRFSGFDKTPSSNKESFFITNSTDSTLHGMSVEIEYTDLNGRELHRRSMDIECDIPSSDTRRVDIPTWDLQHAFRHYRCAATRRPTTPFRVSVILQSVVFQ